MIFSQSRWFEVVRIAALPLASVASVFLLFACDHSETELSEKTGRFEFVEHTSFGSHKAQIFLDTETGVKYLYIWEGGPSNGGPAVTRLWEE